jgi:FADH2 O2-dependent halogenase
MSDADVIVIGGGPAGSVLASLLAQAGYRAVVLERDMHPRNHVGESITPSTNPIFKRIGFLEKIEDVGFVHKPGACWTAPHAPVGKFLGIRLGEFPPPGATQLYTYNVERDVFDTLLIRHAHELGAKVVQGVRVQKVLFDGDRAVGVQAKVTDGWEHELFGRFVVDASGRRCVLASQLGLKRKDPFFDQFAIYSWFKDVEPNPPGYEGMLFLHFLGLERAWAWQIPLRNGLASVGVVVDRADFKKSGMDNEEFFTSLITRSRSLRHNMRNAERVRPWWLEGDYSYKVDKLAGTGWLLIGDALRFVDPIFSTGVDVACYSALYAFQAIDAVSKGEDEEQAFAEYERRVGDGVEAWYDLIALFYKLQNLFTMFAVDKRYREKVVRILQGNLYLPESLQRAREIIAMMEGAYAEIMAQPSNLLRPGALSRDRKVRDAALVGAGSGAAPRDAADAAHSAGQTPG